MSNPKLSVNINKVATIRNARGGNIPDLIQVAIDCEKFGAQGITVHPRPDERHIRYQDVRDLKKVVTTEFNIEGYPSENFINLVLEVVPEQVTLVPDPPEAITSNNGWDTITYQNLLKEVIERFHQKGIRTSIFVNPDPKYIAPAKETGTDRIEMYTESYASNYLKNREKAIQSFIETAQEAYRCELGINAGHDLALNIPHLLEVSIGHALISDALYFGLKETIERYKQQLVIN
jgi:pyridoxine 5-phosphate synthase